jgi:carboxylesterase type B
MLWFGVPNVCKNADDKIKLESTIRQLQARVDSYDGKPEPTLPFNLRSIGSQTSVDLMASASSFENPFYADKNQEEFEKGVQQSQKISLSTMEHVQTGSGVKPSGGTISPEKPDKKKKRRSKAVADCFAPETISIHHGKGGDGFEAWKGSKQIIRK